MKRKPVGGLVYNSSLGTMCPGCRHPVAQCVCREKVAPVARGPVRVGRETKGRKGKGVTVVTGLPLAAPELEKLASELKRKCGAGGTVADGVIEIQGDHRDALVEELTRRGWSVKRAGG